jgi:hypothetical protein
VKKSKKRAISERSRGASDNDQYMFGVHRTIQCAPNSLSREARNQGLLGGVAPYCPESSQRSDPTVDC